MKLICGLEDVTKYELSELNWKDSVTNVRLYFTNKLGGCRCGKSNCNGKYEEITIEKAIELLGNKKYEIFNQYEANVINFEVPTNSGTYYENWVGGSEIYVNLDFDKNWKHTQLVIELNNTMENLKK